MNSAQNVRTSSTTNLMPLGQKKNTQIFEYLNSNAHSSHFPLSDEAIRYD